MQQPKSAHRYYVIVCQEEGESWFFADGEHGRSWVIRPYQAKRFRTFHEAHQWMQCHVADTCRVSEITD